MSESKMVLHTYTGKVIDFQNLTPDPIDIRDIAWGLSGALRYGAQNPNRLTVAQHSVMCSLHVASGLELHALLHDATEAYMADIPTPVKQWLPDYQEMEDRLWREAIGPRFALFGEHMPAEIKHVDRLILLQEIRDFGWEGVHWQVSTLEVRYIPEQRIWTPEEANRKFLERFLEITQDAA
jgi:uncharacterized protein